MFFWCTSRMRPSSSTSRFSSAESNAAPSDWTDDAKLFARSNKYVKR